MRTICPSPRPIGSLGAPNDRNEEQGQKEHRMQQDDSMDAGENAPE